MEGGCLQRRQGGVPSVEGGCLQRRQVGVPAMEGESARAFVQIAQNMSPFFHMGGTTALNFCKKVGFWCIFLVFRR